MGFAYRSYQDKYAFRIEPTRAALAVMSDKDLEQQLAVWHVGTERARYVKEKKDRENGLRQVERRLAFRKSRGLALKVTQEAYALQLEISKNRSK